MNIENSNSVRPEKDKYVIDDSYPNLHFMGMQGFSKNPEYHGKINMLCSKCNTGTHHGDSEPVKATASEMGLACFSKSNMITPGDHISGTIIRDNKAPHGYRLSPAAIIMLAQMEKYCKENDISSLDITKHPLYELWAEQGLNFDVRQIIHYKGDIANDIKIIADGGVIDYFRFRRSWRDNQSEEERDKNLRIAELKRTIKADKRKFHNSDGFNTEKAINIHQMEVELRELKA